MAIVPLPPQVKSWSSWVEIDLWLPLVRWPEGDLKTSSGCVSLILCIILWKVSCRTVVRCQIWKPLGFQICIWSTSTQIPLRSFQWSSRVVRLPPIWWSSRFQQLGISVIFVQREKVSWCPDTIEQMARVSSLELVSPVVNGWGFRTSGTYRKRECKRLRPSALSTNSNPFRRVCVLRSMPLSDYRKSPHVLLSSRTQFQVCQGSVGMGVRSPFYIICPVLGRILQTRPLAFLLRRGQLVKSLPPDIWWLESSMSRWRWWDSSLFPCGLASIVPRSVGWLLLQRRLILPKCLSLYSIPEGLGRGWLRQTNAWYSWRGLGTWLFCLPSLHTRRWLAPLSVVSHSEPWAWLPPAL